MSSRHFPAFGTLFAIIPMVALAAWATTSGSERSTASAQPGPTATSDGSSLVAPGAEVRRLATGFTFTEGPVADTLGGVYFTDVRESIIHRWTPEEGAVRYREATGRSNGLYFDHEGGLIVCESGNKRITRDDLAGTITVLTDEYGGQPYNAPNDLWVHPDGSIYFTDPNFGGVDTQDGHHVYRIPPDGGPVVRLTDDLVQPNGVLGTPDGKTLYITDSSGPTWRYLIQDDGTLSDKTLFNVQGGDGMTLDERGNVYLASGVVWIFSPAGELIKTITAPESPSNVTFGGPEGRTLFFTARTSFYAIDMVVRGEYAPTIDPAVPTSPAEPTPPEATPTTIPAEPTPTSEPMAPTETPAPGPIYMPISKKQ